MDFRGVLTIYTIGLKLKFQRNPKETSKQKKLKRKERKKKLRKFSKLKLKNKRDLILIFTNSKKWIEKSKKF